MPGFRAAPLIGLGDIFAFDRDDADDAPNNIPTLAVSEPPKNGYTPANHVAVSTTMLPPVTKLVDGTVAVANPSTTTLSVLQNLPLAPQDQMPTPGNVNTGTAEGDAEVDADDDESSAESEPEERIRRDGASFVKGRQITADLDPTDSMIVNLKKANYPNEYIAEELRKNGLVAYDGKTVGSRYIRIMRKIEEREAQRLEDELTDWEEGEDEALLRADELAQNEIKDIIQRAKARRWQIVSKNLHKILKKELKYGPKACEKRFVELMDDRASIPPTMDDDPEGRKAERAIRIMDRLHERNIKAAREKTAREEKAARAREEKLRREVDKSRRAKERFEKAAQKAAELEKLSIAQTKKHKAAAAKRAKEEERAIEASKALAHTHNLTYTPPPRAEHTPHPASAAPISASSRTGSATPAKRKRVLVVDPETADSPRNRMSVKELGQMLNLRGLHKSGSKAELIKRLEASDQTMSAQTLKEKLRAENVNTEGSRQELIKRLVASDVAKSAWGKLHAIPSSMDRSASMEDEPLTKRTKITADANETDADDEDDVDDDMEENAGKDETMQRIREPTADSGVGGNPALD